MKQFSYVLTRSVAPHARPLGRLIKESGRFSSRIRLSNGVQSAVIKRVKDMLGVELTSGRTITVTVEGRDEEAAVAALQNYVVANF